ncbi:hypothetical protein ElyMa_002338900 [Elysia marginata]|uniref:Uncharacterized protein n=1 Tax=Elysia marginata TaxID=1093978 RepID=A0AAV4G6J9_9GAST|nr:hypothetical protein ElyMa_002338900 [Elysia marginata]
MVLTLEENPTQEETLKAITHFRTTHLFKPDQWHKKARRPYNKFKHFLKPCVSATSQSLAGKLWLPTKTFWRQQVVSRVKFFEDRRLERLENKRQVRKNRNVDVTTSVCSLPDVGTNLLIGIWAAPSIEMLSLLSSSLRDGHPYKKKFRTVVDEET